MPKTGIIALQVNNINPLLPAGAIQQGTNSPSKEIADLLPSFTFILDFYV